MTMKSIFANPELEVIKFANEDIVTSSTESEATSSTPSKQGNDSEQILPEIEF